jgi:heterodisulfide reductase subunit A-like polyferredoxin/coenzyme F420-reducing hydrogenase delta subunit
MNVYTVLSHPLREKILKILDDERLITYNALLSKLGLEETGVLNYHLKKLSGFVEKSQGFYQLTTAGQNAIRLMVAKNQIMSGKSIDMHAADAVSTVQRIGVILCSCGGVIESTIDISDVTEKVLELPNVVARMVFPFLCMLENLEKLKTWSSKHFLTGIVVAACSPRLHSVFRKISEQLEIPIEFTNIREQCSWVHRSNPESATEKVLYLVSASIAKLRHRVPAVKREVPIRKSVAIVGGGLAGLVAASVLAQSKLDVILIEKDPCLGGVARKWEGIHGLADCSPCMINELVSGIMLQGNVRIVTESELTNISGECGNYTITAVTNPRFVDLSRCTMCGECIFACPELKLNEFEFGIGQHRVIHMPYPFAYPHKPVIDIDDIDYCLSCRDCMEVCSSHAIDLDHESRTTKFTVGGIILAIGAELCSPEEPGTALPMSYDPYNDVISSYEFERLCAPDGPTKGKLVRVSDGTPAKSIVVLQCISPQRTCSGYCCSVARKYMDIVSETEDGTSIIVLYNRALMPSKPNVTILDDPNAHVCNIQGVRKNGRYHIIETDTGNYKADLIVLNMGMQPNKSITKLQADIGFNLSHDEYIVPMSLPTGIWACGSVTGPKAYPELVREAQLAALEALIFLYQESHETAETTAATIQENCGLCGLCVEACPHHALTLVENLIRIDPFKCKGCGICASICPTRGIVDSVVQDEIPAALSALSKWRKSPKILVLSCESCGYTAVDNAGVRRYEYNPGALVVPVPCIGCIDAHLITSSLQDGFDGVLLVGGYEGTCRHLNGVQLARKRVDSLIELLGSEIKDRVRLVSVSAMEGHKVADLINQFIEDIGGTLAV